MAPGLERPDPEVQAGSALRRLRLAQGWSQEEVAGFMKAYGYNFHQTMIAKIEAAQRPLRVRELADFAALYGVEVHELLYPPNGSLADIDQEIARIEAQGQATQRKAREASMDMHIARDILAEAEERYRTSTTDAAMLRERLAALHNEREKLARMGSRGRTIPQRPPQARPIRRHHSSRLHRSAADLQTVGWRPVVQPNGVTRKAQSGSQRDERRDERQGPAQTRRRQSHHHRMRRKRGRHASIRHNVAAHRP